MNYSRGVNLMNKKIVLPACFVVLFLLILNFQNVFAHEAINVGDYQIEIGWVTEPAVAGQMNAVVVNVTTADEAPVENVSDLVVSVEYGGQSKTSHIAAFGRRYSRSICCSHSPRHSGTIHYKAGWQIGRYSRIC